MMKTRLYNYALVALMAAMPLVVSGCSSSKKSINGEKMLVINGKHRVSLNKKGGNRETITKTLSLKNFHGINAKAAVWVEYTQGSDYNVVFEGRQKDFDDLKFTVENGVLVVAYSGKKEMIYDGNDHYKLRITAPHIDQLKVSGVLNIEAKRIKERVMDVDVSGVLNADIELLECNAYEVKNSGVMNCDMKVEAKTANITTSGVDNSDVDYETDELNMKINGASNANVGAKGGTVNVVCSGYGNTTLTLDCRELNVKAGGYLNVELKGVADKVEISGAGVSNVTQKELNNF